MCFKIGFIILAQVLSVFVWTAVSQETNPVEREVANPLTDTPRLNPVAPQRKLKTVNKRQKSGYKPEGGGDKIVAYYKNITSTGPEGKRVIGHEGKVVIRYVIYRLQADKITVYEAQNKMVAEGSVVFDQGEDQRITGTTGVWNYKTKLGTFKNSTGYTNQTDDGTVMYFTADTVERTKLNEVVVRNGVFTACEDAVPKWSFTAKKATIIPGDKIKLKTPKFKIKNIPIAVFPFLTISLKKEDRKSGFLTPTFGHSERKGFRLSNAYYQTLGRSADVTVRNDLFSARGIGYGFDLRTRANSRSFFNAGFYGVKDRILGASVSPSKPDQGGTSIYANGIHFFSNGFVGVVDVKLTSSLAFRQVFSEGIQQIISPIEKSQAYINKSWGDYTLNVVTKSEDISIPNVRVKTRSLPGVHFEKRPSPLKFFDKAYFSFKTSLEGLSRRETVSSLRLYREAVGSDPIITPSISQRLDVHPQLTIPFNTKYFSLTATAGGRATYYSDSFDNSRNLTGRDLVRSYGEFELDFRPVALARNFYRKNESFRVRHVIEPYLTYRYINGINDFKRIIRFDYSDTQTDTNEIEFGVTNRFFTRRYTEAVTSKARKQLREGENVDVDPLAIQPYEIFTFTIRGKYFFDPTFGGALAPGQRNQISPITDLTFYTFGGVPRRFSPLSFDATYRPKSSVFINTRMDWGVQGGGLRNISTTISYRQKLFRLFQTFYFTRAITLIPSLRKFSNRFGKEAGTLRGSQWSPSVFIGNSRKGFYGGTSLFFDFENRRSRGSKPLIRSIYTFGYAFDCCALTTQYSTFNVGLRNENSFVFTFRLNGIGTFGTEQFGQGRF